MKESSNLQDEGELGVFAHDCEGHAIMEWAAGEACVGGEYAPEYAIEAAGWACSCTL
jgi:hypothetical protein